MLSAEWIWRKREVKNDFKIFGMNIWKYRIPKIEMGNTTEEANLGRIIRNSVLDMLSLKYLLGMQVKARR